jgi:F-type H+-transporting ATPase subunit alpha
MIKSIANKLKLELAQFREVEIFTTFDAELDEITTHKLERGLRLVELTKQGANAPLNYFAQVVIIFSGLSGSLDRLNMDQVKVYKKFVVDTSKYFENFDFDMFALKELQEITLQLIVNYIKSELNFKKTI